jgi:hypothetical protein
MRILGRPVVVATTLCAGIVAGAVLFSGRGMIARGAQGAAAEGRPAALLECGRPDAGSRDPRSLQNDIPTLMVLIKSRGILDRALADREVANLDCVKRQTYPADWLADHLLAENPAGTSLIRVSLDVTAGVTSKEQAALINRIVGSFIEQDADRRKQESRTRIRSLESQLEHRLIKLRYLTSELDELTKKSEGGYSGQFSRDALASYSMDLRRKRLDLELELAGAKAGLAHRTGKAAANPVDSDERARLEDRLASLEAQKLVLATETQKVERGLGEAGASKAENAARLREEIRHQGAGIDRLRDRFEPFEIERDDTEHPIKVVDPAVAR